MRGRSEFGRVVVRGGEKGDRIELIWHCSRDELVWGIFVILLTLFPDHMLNTARGRMRTRQPRSLTFAPHRVSYHAEIEDNEMCKRAVANNPFLFLII
jgi:hypothetical protein